MPRKPIRDLRSCTTTNPASFEKRTSFKKLSPATDQKWIVNTLSEIILKPDPSSTSTGDIVSFDIAKVGLGPIPIDEILDFRNQHYRQHQDYIQTELIGQVITVSLETVDIVEGLPALDLKILAQG